MSSGHIVGKVASLACMLALALWLAFGPGHLVPGRHVDDGPPASASVQPLGFGGEPAGAEPAIAPTTAPVTTASHRTDAAGDPRERAAAERRELVAQVEAAANRATRTAIQRSGTPYLWGGTSPRTGFDCSGLVQWAYRGAGIDLPRTTWAMWTSGPRVPRRALQRGDLVFAYDLGHMGIYVGNDRWVHASRSRGVVVDELPSRAAGYHGAVRVTLSA